MCAYENISDVGGVVLCAFMCVDDFTGNTLSPHYTKSMVHEVTRSYV